MTFTSQIKITGKDQASPEIRKIANELDKLAKKAQQSKKAAQGLSFGKLVGAAGLGNIASDFVTNTIQAVPAAVADSITTLADFERKFTFIRANAPDAISKLKELKQQALDLGASTTFDAIQVADAQKELFKKGFSAMETIAAMPGVVYAAAAAEMDLASTSDIVSSALRAFGLQAKESGMVADVLAMSANVSAAGIGELGMSLKYVAPVARASNQRIHEIVAALSLLANAGIQASDAGTDLSQILLNIQTQKKAKDVLKLLGVNAYDASGKMRPLMDITQELTRKTAKYSDARRTAIAKDIAGAENFKSLIVLMQQNATAIEQVRTSLNNSSGAAEKAAEVMSKDLKGAMDELNGAVQTLKITFASLIDPAVIQFLKDATKEAQAFTIAFGNMDKGFRTGDMGAILTGAGQLNETIFGDSRVVLDSDKRFKDRQAGKPTPSRKLDPVLQAAVNADQMFQRALGVASRAPYPTPGSLSKATAPQEVKLTVDIKTPPGTTATVTNAKTTRGAKLQAKTGNRNNQYGYMGFNFL